MSNKEYEVLEVDDGELHVGWYIFWFLMFWPVGLYLVFTNMQKETKYRIMVYTDGESEMKILNEDDFKVLTHNMTERVQGE